MCKQGKSTNVPFLDQANNWTVACFAHCSKSKEYSDSGSKIALCSPRIFMIVPFRKARLVIGFQLDLPLLNSFRQRMVKLLLQNISGLYSEHSHCVLFEDGRAAAHVPISEQQWSARSPGNSSSLERP
jgi:hypothetical protein